MKRENNIFDKLISDHNLRFAIWEVDNTHRWRKGHRPNRTVEWVESDIPARVEELREILTAGFEPSPYIYRRIYDRSSDKYRDIYEPKLWPDQYVHHALIQVLQPIMMRQMDDFVCGSIKGRGIQYGKRYIEKWMRHDPKHTVYCAEFDIYHFYDSLKSEVVISRMKELIKDSRVLALCENITRDGVKIGAYCSQWFANTVLQPLDRLVRESQKKHRVYHYVRQGKKILKGLALSILSRLGQLKHCNSYRIRRRYAPQILIEELKAIIRNYAKEEKLKGGLPA